MEQNQLVTVISGEIGGVEPMSGAEQGETRT